MELFDVMPHSLGAKGSEDDLSKKTKRMGSIKFRQGFIPRYKPALVIGHDKD